MQERPGGRADGGQRQLPDVATAVSALLEAAEYDHALADGIVDRAAEGTRRGRRAGRVDQAGGEKTVRRIHISVDRARERVSGRRGAAEDDHAIVRVVPYRRVSEQARARIIDPVPEPVIEPAPAVRERVGPRRVQRGVECILAAEQECAVVGLVIHEGGTRAQFVRCPRIEPVLPIARRVRGREEELEEVVARVAVQDQRHALSR